MTESAQSLAEKIRRLELQGAELLGSGGVWSHLDGPPRSCYGNESLESDGRARRSTRFSTDAANHLKGYDVSPRATRSRSCDENIVQPPSRFRQLEADIEQRETHETMRAEGMMDSSAILPSRGHPLMALSFAGGQPPPPPASKARRSLPMFSGSGQQSEVIEQTETLKAQLDEANHRCEQMRLQFRSTIEDLNRRLHETIAEKESLQETRQKNELAQDALIDRLQTSLRQLREAYEVQERALSEADSRSELLRTAQAEQEQIAIALRQAVSAAEQRQQSRSPHGTSAPTAATLPGVALPAQRAALMLQNWLEEADNAVKARDACIAELERESEDRQKSLIDARQSFEKSTEEKIARLKESSSKLLQAAEERSDNLREQLGSHRARATFLEEQLDQHAKANAKHIQELEDKISMLNAELQEEKKLLSSKDLELKQMADDARRAAALANARLDEAGQQAAMLQKRIDTYEVMLERLRAECELERSQSQRLWRREEEVSLKRNEAEAKLAEREAEIVRLRELVSSLKEESARQLSKEIKTVESQERERSAEEHGILRKQLEAVTKDHEQTAVQLCSTRTELQAVLEKVRTLEARLESTQRDLLDEQDRLSSLGAAHQQAVTENVRLAAELQALTERHAMALAENNRTAAEINSMRQQLDEAGQRLTSLTAERDRYAAALSTSEAEARVLNVQAGRLQERLAETEAAACRSGQEHAAVMAEVTTAKISEAVRAGEERAGLQAALDEAVEKAQKSQTSEQQLMVKLKSSKIKLAEQVADLKRMEEMLQQKDNIVRQLQKELAAKDADVRTCKESIASLVDERNILVSALKGQEGQSQSEIGRLLEKLNALDREYRLSQQTLQARDSVDEKAVHVADRLQKELTHKRKVIDELMGKIRWLEECLDVSDKEKRSLAEANEHLAENLARLEELRSGTAVAVTAEQLQQHRLQERVRRLEAELDRMVTRCQQLQSALHQSEQQTATLKLKQRLDIAAKACSAPAGSGDASAKSGQQVLLAGAQPSVSNTAFTTGIVTPLTTRGALPCSEDHGTTADVKAMIMEVKAMLSATQKETALSAGSAVRDALEAVLPALITASRSATSVSAENLVSRGSTDRSCRNTGALVIRKSTSQRRGKRWQAQTQGGREPDTSTLTEEDIFECDVSRLRKSHPKVVSRSLQIEATLRCQDLEDRLMGLSKMGRHLKTEHNVMMQLLKSQEQHMEYIHDDHVKELLC